MICETVCLLGNRNRRTDDYLKVNIDVDKIHDILAKEKAGIVVDEGTTSKREDFEQYDTKIFRPIDEHKKFVDRSFLF